jgi:hypothetical protein
MTEDQLKFREDMFNHLVDHTIAVARHLAVTKGGEYAVAGDRLDNFRRGARDLDLSMEQVWRVYAGKHWDAITTYVRDMQTGTNRERSESITGRVDDLIVYLMLFKAILFERGVHTIPPIADWPRLPDTSLRDQVRDTIEGATRRVPIYPPVSQKAPADDFTLDPAERLKALRPGRPLKKSEHLHGDNDSRDADGA